MTQEELLEEAKGTAVENEKDLQRLQRIEDDLKKVVWTKPALKGASIVSLRRDTSLIVLRAPPLAPCPAHPSAEAPLRHYGPACEVPVPADRAAIRDGRSLRQDPRGPPRV
ncbi:hypothetical protein T484DRAFT_1932184, partial [Baffinella frigidus]